MAEAPPEHPLFARVYDRGMARAERAGLARMRSELLANAAGRTLEIGAGTGLNLAHYTGAVTELVLAEPDPHMAAKLRERVAAGGGPEGVEVTVVEAAAEDLPFEDMSFDTVVATLVLCTVASQPEALAEARRVLREGGSLLYLEHVRGEGRARAWWQDRLDRPWGWVAGGCHPNRPTGQAIADAGMWIERMDRTEFANAGPLVKPLIVGVATRPSSARR